MKNKKKKGLVTLGLAALFSLTALTVGGVLVSQDDEVNTTDNQVEEQIEEQTSDNSELTENEIQAQNYAITGFDSTSEVLIAQLSEQFPDTIEDEAEVSLDGGFVDMDGGERAAVRSLKISNIPKEFNNAGSLNFFLDKMQKLSGEWTATQMNQDGLVADLGGNIQVDDAVELYDLSATPELPVTLSFIYTTDLDTGLKTIYFSTSALVGK